MPSWSMVLGFDARADGGLDAARAIQVEELGRVRPIALILNLLVVVFTAAILMPWVPGSLLAGWVVPMIVLSVVAIWDNRRARERAAASPRALLLRSTISAPILGLLWAIPPAFFSRWCDTGTLMVLATIVPGLMAGATLLLTAAPLAALLFVAAVGAGGVVMMAGQGHAALGAAPLLLGALMLLACLRNARSLMHRRGIEIALGEKDAVVSLLLREFEEGADWLWQIDVARKLTGVSPRFARKLGVGAETLERQQFLPLLAGDGWATGQVAQGVRDLSEKLRLRQSFANLMVPVTVAGDTRWWSLSATPRHDQTGRFIGFWGVGSDITEQRRSAEKIDRMARHDALTGLANRRQVMETLNAALVSAHFDGRRAVFMIIDLDRFKQVNDTLGHPIGDRLLREVSLRLQALCGDYALCGRLGGDEFAVVVPDAGDAERTARLAEDIIVRLSEPYEIDEHRLFIGASIGSAATPQDGRSVEMLVRNADLALYRAKDDGRGLHRRYEQQLSARAEDRRAIELALRDALEKGQFSLVYQPIVAADGGQVEAFEAFLRWTHPDMGEISPERFVPIAEEARLMGRIGEWVIRTACLEAATWPAPTRLAINLSASQLYDPQLVATLVSALSASGLPADRLELEVAEALFLRQGGGTGQVLDRLHAAGVRVALSDFGTGYASLGYLRGARFSSIKIDRSFVVDACADMADSLALIRAVVAMADSLGMAVTAEGTETEREYAMIRRLGCTQVQGFLFGHPVPAREARLLAGVPAERRVA